MHSLPRSARRPTKKKNTEFPTMPAFLLGSFVTLVLMVSFMGHDQDQKSKSAPEQSPYVAVADTGLWDIVYNPPFKLAILDEQQREIFDLIDEIPNSPSSHGLENLGLEPFGFDTNTRNVFWALGSTEASLRQYNDDGSVVVSEKGCLGALQGCDWNICPPSLWQELYTNIWCGAKAFQEQMRMWDGVFTYAVAGYKGLWQYSRDADGNHILDENGNWIILRDDAGNPKIEKEYQEQVDRVFNNLTIVPRQ